MHVPCMCNTWVMHLGDAAHFCPCLEPTVMCTQLCSFLGSMSLMYCSTCSSTSACMRASHRTVCVTRGRAGVHVLKHCSTCSATSACACVRHTGLFT